MYLKYHTPNLKSKYNLLIKVVKIEIERFKKSRIDLELELLAKLKASESKSWKAVGTNTSSKKIPFLLESNQRKYNAKDKAEIFAQNLAKIFTPYEDDIFDTEFFASTNELKTWIKWEKNIYWT